MPRRIIGKKIGELLIERNVITDKQLKIALEEQSSKGGYVSQHLIAFGFATEFDIANCLSSQYGFAYIPLKNYDISPSILQIVPLKFIKIYSIIPIDKMGDMLTVAMADPLNDGVIEMLGQITNCNIEVVIGTFGEINYAIEKYFGRKLEEINLVKIEETDMLKEDIASSFIQTYVYSGRSRRKYKRLGLDLNMDYSLQGNVFNAKIKNISYVGAFFICNSFIPIDTNISAKIYLRDFSIDALIQVVRVERISETKHIEQYDVNISNYGIAGFFSFMDDDDKKRLAAFLKEKLVHVKPEPAV